MLAFSTSYRKYKAIIFGLTLMIIASTGSAQQTVSNYTMTQFNGEYVSIANDVNSTVFDQDQDDAVVSAGGLPFNIAYDGQFFPSGTTVWFNSNGGMSLGGKMPDPVQDPNIYGTFNNVPDAMMPFSGDLVLNDFNCTGGSFAGFAEVTGTAPNRVVTYEWSDFIIFSYDCYTAGGMQVKIYETTNVIEFWYANPGYSFAGDILPASGSDPDALWIGLTGNPPGADNIYFSTGASSLPPSDLRFTPPVRLNKQLSVSPKILDFGLLIAGTKSTLTVTACNTPDASTNLTLGSATIVGAPDYTITGPSSSTLPPGGCATYNVTFSPTQGGQRSAVLSIVSDGIDSGTQSVILTGTGTVSDYTYDSTILFRKVRTSLGKTTIHYVHLTQTGNGILVFSSINISGADAGQYQIVYTPTNPMQPGAYDSIGIAYTPTIEGKHIATLNIISNAVTNGVVAISLQGSGILPRIVVTPPQLLSFDSTAEGDSICKNVSIWNSGSDTLRIKANFLSSNDGDFMYTGLSGSDLNIAPDQTKNVTICFHPLQKGFRQARLEIRTNIPLTFEAPPRDTATTYQIDIRGTGIPLGAFASGLSGPPTIDSAIIGTTVCRIDTLKNIGDADILITTAPVITGPNGVFTITGFPTLPFTLKARSSIIVTVCGTPDQQGLRTGSISVNGATGGRKPSITLPLFVFGLKVCASPSPIALFAPMQVNVGMSATLCDTITNCGDVASVYTTSTTGVNAASYAIVSGPPAGLATPPGGTAIFCVTFTPTAVGPATASLNVASSDGAKAMSIPLTGEGVCAAPTLNASANVPSTGDNETKTFTFTITNSGTGIWRPGTPTIGGQASGDYQVISVIPQPGGKAGDSLMPNQQAIVTMTFHPPLGSQGTTRTASVSWPLGGPCQADTLNVTLNGSSVQSSVKETVSEGFSLAQSYPNPTQGKASFTYTTPNETEVRITLVDLTGRLVRTLVNGRVSAGEYTVNIDVSNLPSGTYMYMLESGSTKLVRQIILTK